MVAMQSDVASGPYQLAGVVKRLSAFDGKSPWDAYYMQFETLTQVNGWTETEKATYLAVSLRGPALTVLSNIPTDRLYDYRSLVSALEARFGSAYQAEQDASERPVQET